MSFQIQGCFESLQGTKLVSCVANISQEYCGNSDLLLRNVDRATRFIIFGAIDYTVPILNILREKVQ